MDTLNFANELKETLWTIEILGGNSTFHVIPNHALLEKLKSFVFETARRQGLQLSNRPGSQDYGGRYHSFVGDVLDRGIFQRRVRYCIIKLREFSIAENEYAEYIVQALAVALGCIFGKPPEQLADIQMPEKGTLQSLLVDELSKSFETSYYPSDIWYYDFATEHQLTTFDHSSHKWRLSNVGQYILQLSPLELIVFLCVLEITFGRKSHSRYLSIQTLEKLSQPPSAENAHRMHREQIPTSLRLFGIIQGEWGKEVVTDFGRKILTKANANLTTLKDVILILTESEVGGFRFSSASDSVNQIKERTRTSPSIGQDQKASIETAVSLFTAGHYLDSLRLFFSNIEGVLNVALEKSGIPAEDLRGMKPKVERLKKEKVLSTHLSTWAEVVAPIRNIILHGNILEESEDLVMPMFFFIGAFWNGLIEEIDFYYESTARGQRKQQSTSG